MRKALLLILAVTSTCFSEPTPEFLHEKEIMTNVNTVMDELLLFINTKLTPPPEPSKSLDEIKSMLHKEACTLSSSVIDKVMTTLECAKEHNVEHNNILTIIDYSLPSSEKRLWVFDLSQNKLLFHTYVSHGIKSGTLLSTYFSNKNNSKASSMGVYKTDKPYRGRHGLSLQLNGLDAGFNDNASSRAVVMHGGWYVDEHFIKKYGRAGRSWGCPAVPDNLSESIISTIKDNSLFVMYYPYDNWFLKSKFQHCSGVPAVLAGKFDADAKPMMEVNELRDDIFFVDLNKNNKREESEAIMVMTADSYALVFHTNAPLSRMLRRQINNVEYIALNNTEFNNLVVNDNKVGLNAIYFVTPVVKMVRGYYTTEMNIVNFGKIKDVSLNPNIHGTTEQTKSYTLHFEEHPVVSLKSTNRFIRWLGL